MAKERKYGWNGELPAKALSGQALIVLNGLRVGGLKTGKEWAAEIGGQLATRQDPYRVVLYYILILKSKGCIATEEFDIDAVTKKDEVKHAVTVKSAASVVTGDEIMEVLPEPESVEVENELVS